jgi:hypothetical protein
VAPEIFPVCQPEINQGCEKLNNTGIYDITLHFHLECIFTQQNKRNRKMTKP